MRLHRSLDWLVLVSALGGPAFLGAQSVDSIAFDVDNDYLNFWDPPDQRPDHDYTHGTALSLEFDGSLFFGGLIGASGPCGAPRSHQCGRSVLTLGQKIFTPRRVSSRPVPGERPFAGWLYVQLEEESTKRLFAHRIGLAVGVTGEPSLGRAAQEWYHNIAGFPEPIGWEDQLSFEPAFVVFYEYRHLMATRSIGDRPVLMVFPNVGANLGTVRTSAFGGATLRVGWNVAHPWNGSGGRRKPFAIYGTGAFLGELVVRDLFLNGNTFSRSVSVDHRVPVGSYRLGVALRLWGLLLSYDVTTRSRAYETEPDGHTYSSLAAQIGL